MTTILSPFSGRVVPIEEVPDPVFSNQMLGDGLAIMPDTGLAVAPVDGELVVFHSSGHAFAVRAEDNSVTVLVHIGLDTVKMKGEGFAALGRAGEKVTVGQRLVEFNLDVIARAGYSALSPVILPDLPGGTQVLKTNASHVVQGKDVLLTVILP